jgi:hypothetical protein
MTIREALERFRVFKRGKHEPDGEGCVLEVASVARGIDWSDNPEAVGLPDLRLLNDGPWSSDAARTAALIPVVEALWDWPMWDKEARAGWAERVVLRTGREVLPEALRAVAGLESHAIACAGCQSLAELSVAARMAAREAAKGTAQATVWAAEAAARAAEEAARAASGRVWGGRVGAAREAARAAREAAKAVGAAARADEVLSRACAIWAEEALRGRQ